MSTSKHALEDRHYQLQRIADVVFESGNLLLPIEGYERMPLVSLEEAIVPLYDIVSDIRRKAYIAKQRCQEPRDHLTIDESASIFLYTMQWSPECIYSLINQTLRSEQRDLLRPWFLFLELIFTALWKLPSIGHVTLYRGVKLDLSKDYIKGKTCTWWGFSSTTQSIEVLKSTHFLGKTGVRTLFNVECSHDKVIKNHSYYTLEDEVLILPATQFEVTGNLDLGNHLHTITLKEIEPPFPLIEPPFDVIEPTQTKKYVATKSTPEATAVEPIAADVETSFQEMNIGETGNKTTQENTATREFIDKEKKSANWIVSQQKLTDDDVILIANELKTNKFCVKLNLWQNGIISNGAHYIAEMLKVNVTLKSLNIFCNPIGDAGAQFICDVLKHENNTLERLSLSSTGLTDASVNTIIEMITINRTLQYLCLNTNAISKENEQHLKNAAQARNMRLDVS